jgi:hypothetical protein
LLITSCPNGSAGTISAFGPPENCALELARFRKDQQLSRVPLIRARKHLTLRSLEDGSLRPTGAFDAIGRIIDNLRMSAVPSLGEL